MHICEEGQSVASLPPWSEVVTERLMMAVMTVMSRKHHGESVT